MTRVYSSVRCTVFIGLITSAIACQDLTGSQDLPAGTNDPSVYRTSAGALKMRNTALIAYSKALPTVLIESGLLADEVQVSSVGMTGIVSGDLPAVTALDERILPEYATRTNYDPESYGLLQSVRGNVQQALGALAAFDSTPRSRPLRGELFAIGGFAEMQLADLYCSGIPLSTVDFEQDYTYHEGSTTAEVYRAAITRFDSALALSVDSTRFLNLARVGKGRAWLALAQYDSARAAVAQVPDDFQYRLALNFLNVLGYNGDGTPNTRNSFIERGTIADAEGQNALPFVSDGDSRSEVVVHSISEYHHPLYFPAKYSLTGYGQAVVADGIEARLIEAEARLAVGDVAGWLETLNRLRTTGAYSRIDTTATSIDTAWTAGTGGVARLGPLADPGANLTTAQAKEARVTLLFNERAQWLFLTGHRQGDLRRLVRNYQRPQAQVYPTGFYVPPGRGVYGDDITIPIPGSERVNNPLFHGCFDRNA